MKMLRLLLVLTVLCGGIYPLIVTLVGQTLFSDKAQGSLAYENKKVIGSKLLAQKFEREDFFHPRPSAADYATVASGASQSSVIQKGGVELRAQRKHDFPESGMDAWTNSGSGLDPHISPQNARSQLKRVGAVRGISEEALIGLIEKHTEGPTFGIWGQPRVNVLDLNLNLMTAGYDGHTR